MLIERTAILFFETQYAGDGPGPDWISDDDDCRGMLEDLGAKKAEPLVTIPVTGRPAARTRASSLQPKGTTANKGKKLKNDVADLPNT